MQVFLVIEDDGYNADGVARVYASLIEAVHAACEDVKGCIQIECFELGPKGLVAIYDPKGNLQKSFE